MCLPSCNAESLEAEEAGRVLLRHHIDLGLTETRLCEDRHRHLKSLGVVHSAGLAEVGTDDNIGRTKCANIRQLLRTVVHHRILGIDGLRPTTREALPAQHDLYQRAE